MIARVWHGITSTKNADAYESKLKPELLPGVSGATGFLKSFLLRRELGNEVEFVTIMFFDSIDNIRAITGESYQRSIVPEDRIPLLLRHDIDAAHYEIASICESSGEKSFR